MIGAQTATRTENVPSDTFPAAPLPPPAEKPTFSDSVGKSDFWEPPQSIAAKIPPASACPITNARSQ